VFFADQLDAPNTMSDPLLRPYARQFLESLPAPRGATATDQVRELVEVLLPVGRCSTIQVARGLGVTPRTLHRRLTDEHTSFSAIVGASRAASAERCLAGDRHTLTEISELLGFAAPSAFSRWFHQRFGVSPSQWRAAARRTAAG
jgi:AraC-like DNA-binding protein